MASTYFGRELRSVFFSSAARALCLALIFISVVPPASAANWYVNRSSAASMPDGKSWASSWRDSGEIVWASISSGDTIVFSGGPAGSRRYYNHLDVGTSGISIRIAQEASHNGLVVFPTINLRGNQGITLDGARSPSFVAPVGVPTAAMLAPNIGILVTYAIPDGVGVPKPSSSEKSCIYSTGLDNVRIRWLEVSYCGDPVEATASGMWFNTASSGMVRNSEIAYCYVHHNGIDGINSNGGGINDSWENLVVHHSVIAENVDDAIQLPVYGVTVHHSRVSHRWLAGDSGHPDMFQQTFVKGKFRVYNSIVYNSWNAWVYHTLGAIEGGTIGEFQFYGNVCYSERDWIGFDKQNYGINYSAWGNNGSVNLTTMRGVYILNNTMYNTRAKTIDVTFSDDKPGHELWAMQLRDVVIKNNIVLDGHQRSKIDGPISVCAALPNQGTDLRGCHYSEADVAVDYNVVAGVNPRIKYRGTLYADGEEMANATRYKKNTSATPRFRDLSIYDFRLQPDDLVARDRGDSSVMQISPQLPGLGTDLLGVARGQGAGWDIGAFEYSEGGPSGPSAPSSLRLQGMN